ncbi:hypothetical protein [Candidatus Halobonum tyrrellensis]|uniref:Uncharacterized protein n=1 Tax=Candidatus Halobonum tyrrellensis G22 TaxID=1324957 RepID=V4HD41_9EURY|nr:hypothetical protein [Candidatus Halobonum tyrrellensis]ESP87983.1 hypothetical protein K933_11731 [Candidatus Halobonum tyrrellensis G22]
MQRRAAAVYIAFFLVVGAASLTLVTTATTPEFSMENPDQTLQANDTFTVGGTEYAVSEITAEADEEGVSRSGTIAWTNETTIYTEEWDNQSTVRWADANWTVSIPNETNTSQFTLVENVSRTAILENDSSVANQTTTVDGVEYVVRIDNGSRTLVDASEYFDDPETEQFEVGNELVYNANETTVTSVTANGSVTLTWRAPMDNEVTVDDQTNVTLGDTTYLASFPDNSTLQLSSDHAPYREFQEETTHFTDQTNGLWGVSILSFLSVIFLAGLAYMPSRY